MAAANNMTISKFGPSGSSMRVNTNLEHITDASPNITNLVFLCFRFIILQVLIYIDF